MSEYIVGILVLLSAIATFIAALGILRFDNLLARTHVVSKVISYALFLLLIGINIMFFSVEILFKSLIIFHVLIFLSPVSAHLIAKIAKLIDEEIDDNSYKFPDNIDNYKTRNKKRESRRDIKKTNSDL